MFHGCGIGHLSISLEEGGVMNQALVEPLCEVEIQNGCDQTKDSEEKAAQVSKRLGASYFGKGVYRRWKSGVQEETYRKFGLAWATAMLSAPVKVEDLHVISSVAKNAEKLSPEAHLLWIESPLVVNSNCLHVIGVDDALVNFNCAVDKIRTWNLRGSCIVVANPVHDALDIGKLGVEVDVNLCILELIIGGEVRVDLLLHCFVINRAKIKDCECVIASDGDGQVAWLSVRTLNVIAHAKLRI